MAALQGATHRWGRTQPGQLLPETGVSLMLTLALPFLATGMTSCLSLGFPVCPPPPQAVAAKGLGEVISCAYFFSCCR